MKKLGIAVVVLIVVVGAGGWFLFANLDHIVKVTIEKYASAATQTKVTLDGVTLQLTSGNGTLSGLSVGNPAGFSAAKAFYLGSIGVKLDTSTIKGTGPIVISSMDIEKPQVTYELLNSGTSNLQTIQKNTQAYANSFQGKKTSARTSPAATSTADPDKAQPGRKLIIRDLVIRNGNVAISQELLKGQNLSTGLPEIHMTNIGQSSGGATAAEVAQQVFSAIANSAAQASVTELAKQKLSGALKAVPVGAIGGAAADTIGNGVKGLLGQ